MQRFQIFKAGKHVSAQGTAIAFTEDDLKAAVAAYDPAVHEAPIVVGHPKDNGPAYGWIKSLAFNEGAIEAEPIQVDESFAEMVQAGRFKKRSASFYTPDSPNNPKPGTFYLRHVGFLGAQPPAVKGLKDVNFADADEGIVEFGDVSPWAWSTIASAFRGLREWIIGESGVEAADKVLPNYLLSDLDTAAKTASEPVTTNPAAMPAFSEGTPMITQAQLDAEKARADKAEAELATLRAQAANFSERESKLAEREGKMQRAEVETRVDALIKEGKVLPAQKAATVNFAMSLAAGEATFDFGEGDKATKLTQRDLYLAQVAAGPKLVEYGEAAAAAKTKEAEDIATIEARLRAQVASGGKSDAKTK
jgi:hypothetical protein